jgi:diadenosine tetraphosphate (Ap4A) HIT family hydrolase
MTTRLRESGVSCVFCRERDGEDDTNFARIYPELDSRILLESDNLSIFPCIGQLTRKHSLIATKQHLNTFAQAFNSDSCLYEEVSTLISEFKLLHVEDSERLLIFEHGAICSDSGGCGIYHAHIHLVPVSNDIVISSLYEFSVPSRHRLADCYRNIDYEKSYVFAGYFDSELFIEERAVPLRSQYLRQKLAFQLNVDEWDWRKYQYQPSLQHMLDLAITSKKELENASN